MLFDVHYRRRPASQAGVFFAATEYRKGDPVKIKPRNHTRFITIAAAMFALWSLGQHDKAIVHLRRALEINPNMAQAKEDLERMLQSQKFQ